MCLTGFVILILIRRYKYLKLGHLTCSYLIWYGLGRFFIESLRMDSLMLGNIRVAQLVSIAMIITGIVLIIVFNRGSKFKNLYNNASETIDAQKS